MNLAEIALQPGITTPDRLAFSVLGLSRADRWSHARLRAAVLAMAGALANAGFPDGARLPLPPAQDPGFAVTFLAAIAAGLVPDLTAPMALAPPAPARSAPGFAQGAAARTACIGPDGAIPHSALDTRKAAFVGHGPLSPPDRILLAEGLAQPPLHEFGLIETLALGASALVPAAGIRPVQMPLLAARHGATLIAAGAATLREILAAPSPGWAGLRLALVTDRADPGLAADWQDRTGTPLHVLDAAASG